MRLLRLWRTRERRASIKKARLERESDERFRSDVRQRCIIKGRNPNCPYEQLATSWELAAESWEKANLAWKKVI